MSAGSACAGQLLRRHPAYAANITFQFSPMEGDAHAITGIDGCGIPNDMRPVRVPADGIAASKHRQRTEAVEACDGGSQAGVMPVMRTGERTGQLSVGGCQPRPNRAEPSSQVERLEFQP